MSKIVYLKRGRPFIHEHLNSDVMQEQLSYTRRGIGSYFAGKHSVKSGSGLSSIEERLLLPLVLGIPTTTVDFFGKVEKYYQEINTIVPAGDKGLELEVGLADDTLGLGAELKHSDGSKSINFPLNLDNYIRYRHALKHPLVASSPEKAKGNALIQYYFEDPAKVLNSKVEKLKILDLALGDYQQIKLDIKKVKMMVTMMRGYLPKMKGTRLAPVIHTMSPDELNLNLKYLLDHQPEQFHLFASDDNLTKKFRIEELLSAGIITKVGEVFVDADSGEPLGRTVGEVILTVYDPKNTAMLNRFKSAYSMKVVSDPV